MTATFHMFVGERRSPTAIERGWTWESGRLCADTLHRALRALGLDPTEQRYRNLWRDDGALDPTTVVLAEVFARQPKCVIVALGRKVHRELTRLGIPHRALAHPAARGRIRKTERYQAHVREVLA
jgi:hypothetical protein